MDEKLRMNTSMEDVVDQINAAPTLRTERFLRISSAASFVPWHW
jgi:hypothetical protein